MLKTVKNSWVKLRVHFCFRSKEEEEQAVGAHYSEVEDLLQQSDFVMLVVNLTAETEKLTGKKELGLMKPTATLINFSRGRTVSRKWLWPRGEGCVLPCDYAGLLPSASVCDIPVLYESQNS